MSFVYSFPREQADALAGVYVYTYPHYLAHPVEVESNSTFFKIGKAKNSVSERVLAQTRKTGMPEDPVLIRVYEADWNRASLLESDLHTALKRIVSAHHNTDYNGAEWFLTNIETIDHLARISRLPTHEFTHPFLTEENYKKKLSSPVEPKLDADSKILKAIAEVNSGSISERSAAKKYNVPRSQIRRLRGLTDFSKLDNNHQNNHVATAASFEEKELEDFYSILDLIDKGVISQRAAAIQYGIPRGKIIREMKSYKKPSNALLKTELKDGLFRLISDEDDRVD